MSSRWNLAEIPGADVQALPVAALGSLPAPWRIRLEVGEARIDACSVVLPGTWSGAELVYLLAGILLDRVTRAQVVKAAQLRGRASGDRWSWDRISGGLAGVDPSMVEGTVGEALERVGARLVGAWSGVEAEVGSGEEETSRPVRDVLPRPRKPRGKVPTVSRRFGP